MMASRAPVLFALFALISTLLSVLKDLSIQKTYEDFLPAANTTVVEWIEIHYPQCVFYICMLIVAFSHPGSFLLFSRRYDLTGWQSAVKIRDIRSTDKSSENRDSASTNSSAKKLSATVKSLLVANGHRREFVGQLVRAYHGTQWLNQLAKDGVLDTPEALKAEAFVRKKVASDIGLQPDAYSEEDLDSMILAGEREAHRCFGDGGGDEASSAKSDSRSTTIDAISRSRRAFLLVRVLWVFSILLILFSAISFVVLFRDVIEKLLFTHILQTLLEWIKSIPLSVFETLSILLIFQVFQYAVLLRARNSRRAAVAVAVAGLVSLFAVFVHYDGRIGASVHPKSYVLRTVFALCPLAIRLQSSLFGLIQIGFWYAEVSFYGGIYDLASHRFMENVLHEVHPTIGTELRLMFGVLQLLLMWTIVRLAVGGSIFAESAHEFRPFDAAVLLYGLLWPIAFVGLHTFRRNIVWVENTTILLGFVVLLLYFGRTQRRKYCTVLAIVALAYYTLLRITDFPPVWEGRMWPIGLTLIASTLYAVAKSALHSPQHVMSAVRVVVDSWAQ